MKSSQEDAISEHPYDKKTSRLTIVIPAYNESENIKDTICSLQIQTVPPYEIIVVDDCSTDGTGDIARACGVTTIRPSKNTGYKSGACNYGLENVSTELVMVIDADTTLAPDAIEKLLPAFNDTKVAAAGGYVLPKHTRTIWERARYIEYLMAFTWFKFVQEYYNNILVSAGCFTAFRTELVKESGGWNPRTLARGHGSYLELLQKRLPVCFMPNAVCYTIEPKTFKLMHKQLRRWTHGYLQCIKANWSEIQGIPHLSLFISVPLVDAILSTMVLFSTPILAIYFSQPLLLLLYLIDLPTIFSTASLRQGKGRK